MALSMIPGLSLTIRQSQFLITTSNGAVITSIKMLKSALPFPWQPGEHYVVYTKVSQILLPSTHKLMHCFSLSLACPIQPSPIPPLLKALVMPLPMCTWNSVITMVPTHSEMKTLPFLLPQEIEDTKITQTSLQSIALTMSQSPESQPIVPQEDL